MKISQVLKDIRQQHQLTQEALAERLNVSRSAIARWESGKGIPDIGNLIAISREFDLSLDQLIKEDERLEKKVIEDSKAKKWHYLVILYLFFHLSLHWCLCLFAPYLYGRFPCLYSLYAFLRAAHLYQGKDLDAEGRVIIFTLYRKGLDKIFV